jgi:hypothetical protein
MEPQTLFSDSRGFVIRSVLEMEIYKCWYTSQKQNKYIPSKMDKDKLK